ncbi:hypothetical protein C5B96_16975 [Subtercola sp. Z020]|nr:hypothetical protein C5B96_16975 [Subtercola sp. Z020]
MSVAVRIDGVSARSLAVHPEVLAAGGGGIRVHAVGRGLAPDPDVAGVAANASGLARRLHDSNHSGYWIFIGLIPIVGAIVLLVFVLSGPNPAGARFDKPTS